MNKLDSTLPELFKMLKTIEEVFKNEKDLVLLVQSFRMSKKKDKNNKSVVSKTSKTTGGIIKDKDTCHHCGNKGH
jgi:hypothetical protein